MSFWDRLFGRVEPEEVILKATDSMPVRASKLLRRAGIANKVDYINVLESITHALTEYRDLDKQNAFTIVDNGIAEIVKEVAAKSKVKEKVIKAPAKDIAPAKKETKAKQPKTKTANPVAAAAQAEPPKKETTISKPPKSRKAKTKTTTS